MNRYNKKKKSLYQTKKTQASILKSRSSKFQPKSRFGRVKSRTVCRFDGKCKFHGKCRFFHPKERMGSNRSVMESWAANTDPDNLLKEPDCNLFQYKLTTALTLIAYFLHLGVPITEDFLTEHDYLEEFIDQLKERDELGKFSTVYSNINHFIITLKRIHTKVSLRNVLTDRTLRNHDNITLWRGFRSNYFGFLDNLQIHEGTLQTPIILATSLSEDIAYRFTALARDVPIIWKINIARGDLDKISGTLFERNEYNIDLRAPEVRKELEVILPMDSVLRFKGDYEGKTKFKSLDKFGDIEEVDISDLNRVKIMEWDFLGIGEDFYQRNFVEKEGEVIEVIRSLIPGVGKLKLKKRNKRGKNKGIKSKGTKYKGKGTNKHKGKGTNKPKGTRKKKPNKSK